MAYRVHINTTDLTAAMDLAQQIASAYPGFIKALGATATGISFAVPEEPPAQGESRAFWFAGVGMTVYWFRKHGFSPVFLPPLPPKIESELEAEIKKLMPTQGGPPPDVGRSWFSRFMGWWIKKIWGYDWWNN